MSKTLMVVIALLVGVGCNEGPGESELSHTNIGPLNPSGFTGQQTGTEDENAGSGTEWGSEGTTGAQGSSGTGSFAEGPTANNQTGTNTAGTTATGTAAGAAAHAIEGSGNTAGVTASNAVRNGDRTRQGTGATDALRTDESDRRSGIGETGATGDDTSAELSAER